MKFRISNGYNYAVEFHSFNEGEFRIKFMGAFSDYITSGNKSGQLHVATDNGEWLPPSYPDSNNSLIIDKFLTPNELERVWRLCARSNNSGTWFEYELNNIANFITEQRR